MKGSATKPSPVAIMEQAEYLREVMDDVRDFPLTEVVAIAEWVISKVNAGSITRTLTTEMRRNGGRVKNLRVRQKNYQRDLYIVKLHNDGLTNVAVAARVGISEGMIRKVLKREGGNG